MKGNGFILRTPGGEILQREDCQLIRGIHPRAFVMVPFDFHEENVWSMPITSVKQDESADANCRYPYPDSDTTEREHSAMVRSAIAFAATNRGKCIISTVTRRPVSLPPEELFARLEKRYPTVCTFLFSTTATGTASRRRRKTALHNVARRDTTRRDRRRLGRQEPRRASHRNPLHYRYAATARTESRSRRTL